MALVMMKSKAIQYAISRTLYRILKHQCDKWRITIMLRLGTHDVNRIDLFGRDLVNQVDQGFATKIGVFLIFFDILKFVSGL